LNAFQSRRERCRTTIRKSNGKAQVSLTNLGTDYNSITLVASFEYDSTYTKMGKKEKSPEIF